MNQTKSLTMMYYIINNLNNLNIKDEDQRDKEDSIFEDKDYDDENIILIQKMQGKKGYKIK